MIIKIIEIIEIIETIEIIEINENIEIIEYRTRAIKGRADYSKIIFWEFSAASNQERLQIEKYFLDLY